VSRRASGSLTSYILPRGRPLVHCRARCQVNRSYRSRTDSLSHIPTDPTWVGRTAQRDKFHQGPFRKRICMEKSSNRLISRLPSPVLLSLSLRTWRNSRPSTHRAHNPQSPQPTEPTTHVTHNPRDPHNPQDQRDHQPSTITINHHHHDHHQPSQSRPPTQPTQPADTGRRSGQVSAAYECPSGLGGLLVGCTSHRGSDAFLKIPLMPGDVAARSRHPTSVPEGSW
jgi:hypothetical protein